MKTPNHFIEKLIEIIYDSNGYIRDSIKLNVPRYIPTNMQEDIIQDTVTKLLVKGGETYDQSKSFKAWLSACIRNNSVDFYRRYKNNPLSRYTDLENADFFVGSDHFRFSPADIDRTEAFEDLQKKTEIALKNLPTKYKDILTMRMADNTYGQIGRKLGLNLGTVKSRMHFARNKLQNSLEAQGYLFS